MRDHGKIRALAIFHRNALILECPVFLLAFWRFGYEMPTMIIMAVPVLLYCAWSVIGARLQWKHIYCSYQLFCHRRMTPENIRFCEMTFSDMYGVYIVLAIAAVMPAIITAVISLFE